MALDNRPSLLSPLPRRQGEEGAPNQRDAVMVYRQDDPEMEVEGRAERVGVE